MTIVLVHWACAAEEANKPAISANPLTPTEWPDINRRELLAETCAVWPEPAEKYVILLTLYSPEVA